MDGSAELALIAHEPQFEKSEPPMTIHKRKRKLIEPRLQLRFFVLFLVTVGLAASMQTIVLSYVLGNIARDLPADGLRMTEAIPGALQASFFFTLALLTPLTLALGIHQTFRVVGPLHRIRIFLRSIVEGEEPGACQIRAGDDLQDLCALLNDAVERLQADQGAKAATPPSPTEDDARRTWGSEAG